jgi:hypothetical protein
VPALELRILTRSGDLNWTQQALEIDLQGFFDQSMKFGRLFLFLEEKWALWE